MTRIAFAQVLTAFVLVLAACGGSSSSPVGTWVLDIDAGLTPEQRKEMESTPQSKEAYEKLKAAFAVEFELRADGTFRGDVPGIGQGASAEGRWEEKGGVVTVRGDKGPPMELRLKDGNLVGTIAGKGKEATFRRK